MTRRNLSALAIAAIPCALGLVLLSTHSLDAGSYRLVQVGGTVRLDTERAGFHLLVEKNATHHPEGLYGPRCIGDDLNVRFRPASRVAGWGSASVDGWLLRNGYSVGLAAVHGADVSLGFMKDGAVAPCREVMSHAAGNVWIAFVQSVAP